jgi:glycogen operon protein
LRAGRFDIGAGQPYRLGANYEEGGTNFALWSAHATAVELCLFDPLDGAETRLHLPSMEGGIWFGHLPGIRPGQDYGYRVHGPFAPAEGHRFNPAKLLIDPYARMLSGDLVWDDALFGYPIGGDDLARDDRDSAAFVPKSVVVDPEFDWRPDRALRHPWTATVICEAHVRGMTMRHPAIPEADRGTLRGLSHPAVIDHLLRLGVTAVELMPLHGFADDRHLQERGLSNYWGYNTLTFFAPHRRYLATAALAEVKETVKAFHAAGIEVILDVVYNHTAEGSELGPTLSFRGIDNAAYYLLSPDDPRHTHDCTGCGNTLNIAHPMVLRMVLDSLRYWVEACHVDGFRFDLATTIGREAAGFERDGAFFAAIRQDPVLSSVKLIAEPWDVGQDGYQVGAFTWPFREWNDRYRDDLRAFWRRDAGMVARLSERLAGSPAQFDHSHRPATSSVNFLAAHDGFTLWDTVSHAAPDNRANGDDPGGHANNLSDNMGAEGATTDGAILAARHRRVRAMLASLFLSQGVPMLLAGDEGGRTQGGNNNAYCQDNDLTWTDWAALDGGLVQAVADLAALRRRLGLARAGFSVRNEIGWWHPAGRWMEEGDWQDAGLCCLGVTLPATAGARGILAVFNASDDIAVTLPDGKWRRVIDTAGTPVTCDRAETGVATMGWQSVALWVGAEDQPLRASAQT